MDVKKFMKLNLDDDAVPECDGLFHRLLVQVGNYSAENCCNHNDKIDLAWIDNMQEKFPDKSLLSERVFSNSTHNFFLSKLQNDNDPNIDCEPKEHNTDEMWKAVYEVN